MGVPNNLPPEAPRFTAGEWLLLGWMIGVAMMVLVGAAAAIGYFLRAP